MTSERHREIQAPTPPRWFWPVAAAASAWAAALWARPVPVWVSAGVAVAAVVARRRMPGALWFCVALAAATNTLAVRAEAGLDPPATGPFEGTVTVITDPEPALGGGVRFEVDSDAGHLLAEVAGPESDVVTQLLAGVRLDVSGTVDTIAPSPWTRSRHLRGTLDVIAVHSVGSAPPPLAAANGFRRTLERGAASLSSDQRSLFVGIVIGDDRGQPPGMTADFRASGLTHLLAVSGQNLVFVLAVATPVLRRLRLWPRWLASVGLVVAFATVTRFEPSVLRAAAVVTTALLATTLGRSSEGVRHVCIAVCALLIIDPLLVHSVGFTLSVAASVGVLVIAPRLAAALRGPKWLRESVAMTVGAQLAVAPVLIPTFGAMPLAALPANVVAGPIAGLTMVWGVVGGTLAGVIGGRAASVLHGPSRVALHALDSTATWAAGLPLGRLDLRHVSVLVLAGLCWWLRPWLRAPAAVAMVVTLGAALVVHPVLGERAVGFDATVWVDGDVAVVIAGRRTRAVDVLEELRSAQVSEVGLVVSVTGDDRVAAAVAERFPVAATIGPEGSGAIVPAPGTRIRVGRILVVVDDVVGHLRVRAGWR